MKEKNKTKIRVKMKIYCLIQSNSIAELQSHTEETQFCSSHYKSIKLYPSAFTHLSLLHTKLGLKKFLPIFLPVAKFLQATTLAVMVLVENQIYL